LVPEIIVVKSAGTIYLLAVPILSAKMGPAKLLLPLPVTLVSVRTEKTLAFASVTPIILLQSLPPLLATLSLTK
jgi:hypothetical protein